MVSRINSLAFLYFEKIFFKIFFKEKYFFVFFLIFLCPKIDNLKNWLKTAHAVLNKIIKNCSKIVLS